MRILHLIKYHTINLRDYFNPFIIGILQSNTYAMLIDHFMHLMKEIHDLNHEMHTK